MGCIPSHGLRSSDDAMMIRPGLVRAYLTLILIISKDIYPHSSSSTSALDGSQPLAGCAGCDIGLYTSVCYCCFILPCSFFILPFNWSQFR